MIKETVPADLSIVPGIWNIQGTGKTIKGMEPGRHILITGRGIPEAGRMVNMTAKEFYIINKYQGK